MDVIIAARLSSKRKPGQGGMGRQESIESQDEDAREWAEAAGHHVVGDPIGDYRSGKYAMWERPNLKPWVTRPELMAQYQGIVVAQQDRLSRAGWRDEGDIRRWAEDNGKTLFIVGSDPPNSVLKWPADNEDGVKRWNNGAQTARDEWLSDQRRALRYQRKYRDAGYLLGRPPYGYQVVLIDPADKDSHKTLKPHPGQAPIVREMYKRYIAGETLAQICADFAARGTTTNAGIPFTPKTMGQLMKRPTMYGSRSGKHDIELTIESIVDAETWQKAVDRLASRNHKAGGPTPRKGPAMLAGVLHCGKCGQKMYLTNTGYYCRACPKGDRYLVPKDLAETMAVEWLSMASAKEKVTTVSSVAKAAAKKIAQIEADARRLTMRSPDYAAKTAAMAAEVQSLLPLLDAPDETDTVETGRTIGEAFRAKPDADKRRFMLDHDIRFAAHKRLVYADGRASDQYTLVPFDPDPAHAIPSV